MIQRKVRFIHFVSEGMMNSFEEGAIFQYT